MEQEQQSRDISTNQMLLAQKSEFAKQVQKDKAILEFTQKIRNQLLSDKLHEKAVKGALENPDASQGLELFARSVFETPTKLEATGVNGTMVVAIKQGPALAENEAFAFDLAKPEDGVVKTLLLAQHTAKTGKDKGVMLVPDASLRETMTRENNRSDEEILADKNSDYLKFVRFVNKTQGLVISLPKNGRAMQVRVGGML
jgi:hypothetical protein